MLRRLLRHMAEFGTVRGPELAQALGVSPALVEAMIEELVRHGYLRPYVPGQAAPCERCPVRASCLYRRQPRVWALGASRRGSANGNETPGPPCSARVSFFH